MLSGAPCLTGGCTGDYEGRCCKRQHAPHCISSFFSCICFDLQILFSNSRHIFSTIQNLKPPAETTACNSLDFSLSELNLSWLVLLSNKFAKYFYAHPNFNDINKEPFDRLPDVLPCIVFFSIFVKLSRSCTVCLNLFASDKCILAKGLQGGAAPEWGGARCKKRQQIEHYLQAPKIHKKW